MHLVVYGILTSARRPESTPLSCAALRKQDTALLMQGKHHRLCTTGSSMHLRSEGCTDPPL